MMLRNIWLDAPSVPEITVESSPCHGFFNLYLIEKNIASEAVSQSSTYSLSQLLLSLQKCQPPGSACLLYGIAEDLVSDRGT